MLFSTRAEYGVRLMVELGRQEDGGPVALSAVAESERLPLSYLEHLVAKLRKAGLVDSQRGAHGCDVVVRHHRDLGAGEADGVDQGGVDVGVGDDVGVAVGQRGDQREVRVVARGEDESRGLVEPVGQLVRPCRRVERSARQTFRRSG